MSRIRTVIGTVVGIVWLLLSALRWRPGPDDRETAPGRRPI